MTDLSPLMPAAEALIAGFTRTGRMIATAESCTGGLIAAVLTEVPGSSAVVERGFVTYSNEAKAEALAVPAELIAEKGAVSREVAMAMAEGALAASRADVAVAVTGVAGPGGGSREKPVGLVHFGFAAKGKPTAHEEHRFGELTRAEIRLATVAVALAGLSKLND
jgi:nicotinamide-nucleotide amidase